MMEYQGGTCAGKRMAFMDLKIGAGKSEVEIPLDFFPEEGFIGIHDCLYARTLLIDNGMCRTALVTVDLTSINKQQITGLKEIISETGNVDPTDIFICASHTFSAPHIRPDFLLVTSKDKEKNIMIEQAVNEAVHRSVLCAKQDMQPAKMGYGTGICGVNVNRDILTSEGWWKGSNDHGPSDRSVSVIRFEDLNGKPIAVFLNYAVQSSIMNESVMTDGGKLVSADLGGAAVHHIELQYGQGVLALFSIGAAGDQAPLFVSNRYRINKSGKFSRADIHEAGYLLVDLLGERLGSEVIRVSEQINCHLSQIPLCTVRDNVYCRRQKIPGDIRDIHPAKQYDYQDQGEIEVPIEIMLIGDAALVGVQAELNCKTGMDIKQKSPFKHTVIMTMVNGAAKYMPDSESYERITYESMNSMFARGSAETVADKIISVLKQLYSQS